MKMFQEPLLEKKSAVFDLIGGIISYLNLDLTSINGAKYFRCIYANQLAAEEACKNAFPNQDTIKFRMGEEVKSAPASAAGFSLKIYDIPLDLDKNLFSKFLNKIDKVSHLSITCEDYIISATLPLNQQLLHLNLC